MREIGGIFADENILPVGRRLAKLPEAGIRAVILTGRGDMTPDGIYDLILKNWDEIAAVERLMPGYAVHKANLAAIGKNVWLGAVVESSA